ncbi:hypothetical protein HW555_011594 [Spodoptera exigua]|uniref:Uncharacterized protein n=1 Tax=Spodoptera exigua TaxID=7107 RepID=A0A835KYP8_SPOEX|nr:hypothetical protein HW555_011594 [Spodoptera exigua]
MLQGRGNKSHLVLNLESDEYAKEQLKSNLYEIEKVIHTKSVKPHSHFEKPEYDINDISTENFKVDIVLNDKMLSKELMKMKEKEDFGAIFEHVGSNETYENDVPATKLLPIQDIQYQNPLVLDQAVNEFELISNNGNFKIPTSTLVEVHDNNQEDSSVDLRFDKVPDVVVI